MTVDNALAPTKTLSTNKKDVVSNPKAILKKDDFLKLLLTELQYQDPTNPMDSEKILSQTSELATLEAANNTNKLLEKLSGTLAETSAMSMVSAIGKLASLGADTIPLDEENHTTFELFFEEAVERGTLRIKNLNGDTIRTIDIHDLEAGTQAFIWDGTDDNGNRVESGEYRVEATYTTPDGETNTTRYGVLPIESVRFEGGKVMVKMGGQYYPLEQVKEIFQG